ncbi:ectonucleoside triphosphate diphosphohydrolase 6 isoform X2 [Stegostoma tigrinum]|uniref:ectonucleoside triphosphate diphosphohydrolase 6 isoform X2 n=1 Tax=Stegostoma tigrinum TaxID=3053191 RepID=UPI00202B0B0B|nr:ectonucleoside triphosphate diphosphohydrolase 6 isoform X2 [Stegostoma tigrinum]
MLGAMKLPKVAYVFVLFVCILIYVYQKKPFQRTQNGLGFIMQATLEQPVPQDFYGIMFDAGSTGTRIHVFKFTKLPNESPKLADETFKALKPGLSAYSDEPHLATKGIQDLLDIAKKSIPRNLWASTPLVLKATAGLRLLPGVKAQHLLDKVKEVFQLSPFLVTNDCVSIMDGTDEGISAWITVNFLIDSLQGEKHNTTGMLDLGGGSIQITFMPHSEMTLQTPPVNYITSIQMFNSTYTLYSHSYLGFGLMSARLAILGGTEGRPLEEGQELVSSCLSPNYKAEWKHAEIVYHVKGQKAGVPIYDSCYARIEKVLSKKLHKPKEVGRLSFYAFSYYYDRAVDVGLIEEKGGTLKVEDYGKAARRVCQSMESESTDKPFLCMDLVYITVLLEELGFHKDAILKLAKKINGVESSWALGATFHYIDSLQRN